MNSTTSISNLSPAPRLDAYAATRTGEGRPNSAQPSAPARTPETDSVDLSDRARFLEALRTANPVRTDLVERIKGEIASGQYETEDRLNKAIDSLLSDLE